MSKKAPTTEQKSQLTSRTTKGKNSPALSPGTASSRPRWNRYCSNRGKTSRCSARQLSMEGSLSKAARTASREHRQASAVTVLSMGHGHGKSKTELAGTHIHTPGFSDKSRSCRSSSTMCCAAFRSAGTLIAASCTAGDTRKTCATGIGFGWELEVTEEEKRTKPSGLVVFSPHWCAAYVRPHTWAATRGPPGCAQQNPHESRRSLPPLVGAVPRQACPAVALGHTGTCPCAQTR